jgi:hypothetical protein
MLLLLQQKYAIPWKKFLCFCAVVMKSNSDWTGAVEIWVETDIQILHMYYGKYYMFMYD